MALSVAESAKYSRRSSSVKCGLPYRASISSSPRIRKRLCVVLVVCVGMLLPSCKFQKVHLLHRAPGCVPFYVSVVDCQIVLDIMKHEEEAMALVGYARVSSVGQRLDVQVAKLQHCDKLFQEHTSGSAAHRLRLVDCLEYVREGDMLVVTRLDRLA